ncbi:hypothetical protein MA20_31930 [Bradyrhizobium japonicum]|uniref:Uncharacterized protein n=1 Tax=Bradyrhizobium japonicum TaxID=375 RepID=A0A0A3XR90_BRAJP|nr:hypothetical protein [Bradyrhizobium japonicum]KGT75804.1 hypothetical protein MA20_31930 [Bradyrhizobium japonicum]
MTDNMFINGTFVKASASFMPSAASYAAGNIIDTAKEFVFADRMGRLLPPGSLIRIISAVMKVDASALISGEAAYTAHTYSVTPPSARANNSAWARASGDLPSYRGSLALGTPAAAGGTCYVKTQFSDQQDFELPGSSLFLELINAGTFTAAAVARQIFLYGFLV